MRHRKGGQELDLGEDLYRISLYKPWQLFWATGINEWRSLGPSTLPAGVQTWGGMT